MATFDTLKTKIQGLIDKSNAKTGESDTDLTSAVDKLIDGYGAGGSSLPEYDGTVIIEKAGVLGLRRFKESVTDIDTFYGDDSTLAEFLNPISFDITPISVDLGGTTVDVIKLTCSFVNDNTSIETENAVPNNVGIYLSDGNETLRMYSPWSEILSYMPALEQFEVISTANSTVDEWLLANTEGVSV